MFEYAAPQYDDRQISAILTKAQLRVFKRRFMPTDNRFGQGFENTEERRRDLEQFIKQEAPTISTTQVGVHPSGVFYDMPEDFLYAVEESLITVESTPNEVTVVPIRHDEYRANIHNPYKRPYANLAWRMDYARETHSTGDTTATEKRAEIIVRLDYDTATYTGSEAVVDPADYVSSYRLRYVQTPPDIVCDEVTPANQVHCILDATLHDEIVDEAVKIATAATQPQEYNVSQAEQTSGES